MNRVKCSNCKSYFDREDAVWANAMQRLCSTGCLSEHLDKKRKPPKPKRERAKRRTSGMPVEVRQMIRVRDVRCVWCNAKGEEVHHVHYRSEGGQDEASNLILLCGECHARAHSSKAAFKPLLLAYIWLYYIESRKMDIPGVARYLEGVGLLTDLQRERMGMKARISA